MDGICAPRFWDFCDVMYFASWRPSFHKWRKSDFRRESQTIPMWASCYFVSLECLCPTALPSVISWNYGPLDPRMATGLFWYPKTPMLWGCLGAQISWGTAVLNGGTHQFFGSEWSGKISGNSKRSDLQVFFSKSGFGFWNCSQVLLLPLGILTDSFPIFGSLEHAEGHASSFRYVYNLIVHCLLLKAPFCARIHVSVGGIKMSEQ